MNNILYIGLAFLLIGFIIFIICQIRISQIEKHLFKQKQLDESFKNADKTNERKYKNTY